MTNNTTLENSVLESLDRLYERYKTLLDDVEALTQADISASEMSQKLSLFNAERAEVQSTQSEALVIYGQYQDSVEQVSEAVRGSSWRVRETVEKLIATFDLLENAARDSQKKLQPIVNENIRAVQMRSTYKKWSRQ